MLGVKKLQLFLACGELDYERSLLVSVVSTSISVFGFRRSSTHRSVSLVEALLFTTSTHIGFTLWFDCQFGMCSFDDRLMAVT